MKKIVGTVDEKDKNEMIDICEKKLSLENLMSITKDNEQDLYEQALEVLKNLKYEYDGWWERTGEKYQLEGDENGHWELDFQTGQVTLVV